MTRVEKAQAALKAKGVNTTATTWSTLSQKLTAAGLNPADYADDVDTVDTVDTANTTNTDVTAVVILGTIVDNAQVYGRDSDVVTNYITQKRSKEFPDYIGSLPDGEYEITNSVMPATWEGGESPATFMLVVVKNLTDNNSYALATWDLCLRMRIHSATTNKDYSHDSVSKVAWTTSSQRDSAALSIPVGTKFFVSTVYGWWINPAKQPKKAYTFKIATTEKFVDE